MSTIVKPDYKIRCGHCQQLLRPIWTMQTIRCPCCNHINRIPRTSLGLDGSPPITTGAGNSQCWKIESLYNKLRDKLSGTNTYYSYAPSGGRLLEGAPSGSLRPSDSGPRKRAVLCGVTYRKKKYKLKGTINDVKNMKQLLIVSFGFLEQNIHVLTEEESDERKIPTKKNIQDALQWLVRGIRSGDSLVFYFSGHGLRLPEHSQGDELDGFDETICPVDFTKVGMISDDEINSKIVRPLVKGVTLHALIDSCHSGTVLDLPNVYDCKEGKWMDNKPLSGANKGTQGGLAISLSACADAEIAADTSVLTGKAMSGAMTYSFVHAVAKNPGLSYGELLRSMQEVIDQANKSNCLNSKLLSRVCSAKLLQEPVLSSTEIFDINLRRFEL
ncbi:hypothetical protein SAY87_018839 [Trapa incisa]|uniref:Peptidase C14 caspase domain-containing protein n=1 Tax=Trapa incisa TaxID=236973 RepID=A0AAN7K4S3_9MYRT|nr:hypothetical protein SAY87_018839 [Trapa incisa]